MIVGFSAYIYVFATFTRHPKTKQSLVLGFGPANTSLKAAFDEGYTPDQALDENEYNPALIWTPGPTMRRGLVCLPRGPDVYCSLNLHRSVRYRAAKALRINYRAEVSSEREPGSIVTGWVRTCMASLGPNCDQFG